jgi:hypothetical protein
MEWGRLPLEVFTMPGRKLASIFGLALGAISFFLPLVTLSQLGNEMRWSGYTVVSGLTGFTSEHFYDIAAEVVYGGGGSTNTSANAARGATSSSGEKTGAPEAIASIVLVAASYCLLLAIAVDVFVKYSPRIVGRLCAVGFAAAAIALASTFMLADRLQEQGSGTFAAERGLVRIDVGYGLYTLLAAFALLLVFQRLAVLDRLLSSPE